MDFCKVVPDVLRTSLRPASMIINARMLFKMQVGGWRGTIWGSFTAQAVLRCFFFFFLLSLVFYSLSYFLFSFLAVEKIELLFLRAIKYF